MKGSPPIICLFAKTPVPGRVKTRMQPQLSGEMSARLAEHMLLQVGDALSGHWPGPKRVHVRPDRGHAVFQRLKSELGFTLELQRGNDLGERMYDALSRGIADGAPTAVVGADVPHLSGEVIRQAESWLREGKEVVGPAKDGGFYLLGLQTGVRDMFEGIRWGEGDVLLRLLDWADSSGRVLHRLPVLRDIDRVDDLRWLAEMDSSYRPFLPKNPD